MHTIEIQFVNKLSHLAYEYGQEFENSGKNFIGENTLHWHFCENALSKEQNKCYKKLWQSEKGEKIINLIKESLMDGSRNKKKKI